MVKYLYKQVMSLLRLLRDGKHAIGSVAVSREDFLSHVPSSSGGIECYLPGWCPGLVVAVLRDGGIEQAPPHRRFSIFRFRHFLTSFLRIYGFVARDTASRPHPAARPRRTTSWRPHRPPPPPPSTNHPSRGHSLRSCLPTIRPHAVEPVGVLSGRVPSLVGPTGHATPPHRSTPLAGSPSLLSGFLRGVPTWGGRRATIGCTTATPTHCAGVHRWDSPPLLDGPHRPGATTLVDLGRGGGRNQRRETLLLPQFRPASSSLPRPFRTIPPISLLSPPLRNRT